ncbi:hypothetical protein FRB95_005785 [Tulasnella sp. JGI-2019a]|nr:hypothetical protein FRB95_005785 [Tulasnella sp. JGI-2019a]
MSTFSIPHPSGLYSSISSPSNHHEMYSSSFYGSHQDMYPPTPSPGGHRDMYILIPCQGALHDIKYPNFEGQMVEKLYPPEIDVIRQALSLLVDSTQRVNQTRHLSTNALVASSQ